MFLSMRSRQNSDEEYFCDVLQKMDVRTVKVLQTMLELLIGALS